MRRVSIAVLLCALLCACAAPPPAAPPPAAPAATPGLAAAIAATPVRASSHPAALSPTPMPDTAGDADSDNLVEVQLHDTVDWETRDAGTLRVELRHVEVTYQGESPLYSSYLLLSFPNNSMRLMDNGPIPDYYLHPCNVTGSGQDMLVTGETTSCGIESWGHELLTLDGSINFQSVIGYGQYMYPEIRVCKTTKGNRVTITADAEISDQPITLIDMPVRRPIDGCVASGVYYLDEGESMAILFPHEEVAAEDIDGDGLDELRFQYYMGDYHAWYGHVTTWYAYDEGNWHISKMHYSLLGEDDRFANTDQTISSLDIVNNGLVLPGDSIDNPATTGATHTTDPYYPMDHIVPGDCYAYSEESRVILESSTDNPARFTVAGLRIGDALNKVLERLGMPHDIHNHEYEYRVDDGSIVSITIKGRRITRFALSVSDL